MSQTRRAFLRTTLATLAATQLGLGCKSRRREVVAYTSVDRFFSEPIFQAFTSEASMSMRAVFPTEETKSAGVVDRILAEGKRPKADVFWSRDPFRIFALIKRGMITRYAPKAAAGIPAPFRAADGSWSGFAARARVLLVNTTRVLPGERPRSIRDLAASRWKGQTAIADPLQGTTAMHAASLFTTWGDTTAKRFFEELRSNGVIVASSNAEVRQLVARGDLAFGLTDTDEAREALDEHAPVEMVYPDQDGMGALLMPTAVVLMRGGPRPDAGRKLIDYLVSPEVEKRLAQSAAHIPLRADVAAPPGVRRARDLRLMKVDYARVADDMERIKPWLERWTLG